jgi:hypothetical protein
VALHGFLDEFQGRGLIPLRGDEGFQHFALVVDSAPKVKPQFAFCPKKRSGWPKISDQF